VVKTINQKDGKVTGVTLKDGTVLEAPMIVNCGGPYSNQITKLAFPAGGVSNDMKIYTRAMKQEVCTVTVDNPMVNHDKDGVIVCDNDVGCYWRPEIGNKILVGTMEPPCDSPYHNFYENPDEANMAFTDQSTLQVYRLAQRIPALAITSATQGIVAFYDVSNDWVPVYDKSSLGGYFMAIGTSGNQFKNAVPAGAMMAELIEKCANGHDHDKDPVQFNLRLKKGRINIGMFSRLREPLGTTNSVMS
jgi:sarcosine oxidase subunit beta